MKLKRLILIICLLLFLIPGIIFAGTIVVPDLPYVDIFPGAVRTPVYVRQSNPALVASTAVCISNSSAVKYFIGNKTQSEAQSAITAFSNTQVPGVSVVTSCCHDTICTAGETCASCPGDCCPPVCTDFTYSAWSGCSNSVQTREVLTRGPSQCIGGSPVVSQSCCSVSVGCSAGYHCVDTSLFRNSTNCTGTKDTSVNNCISDSYPSYSCLNSGTYGPSMVYIPKGAASCAVSEPCPTPTPGCPAGSSCRSGNIFYDATNCQSFSAPLSAPTCISDTIPNGCNNYPYASIYYIPGSGCSY